jgi:hypothetical protein
VGAIVLAADIGVLIWNISVLRKYRVGAGTVISILVVIAFLGATVSAFAGIEPVASYKDKALSFVGSQTAKLGNSATNGHTAKIATVENMWVSNLGNPLSIITGEEYAPYDLIVELKPTKSALPDQKYLVELYENGKYRDTAAIGWNQPELNVSKEKLVRFPIAREEFHAYYMEDTSHIFTVKVIGKSPNIDERLWEKLTRGSQ